MYPQIADNLSFYYESIDRFLSQGYRVDDRLVVTQLFFNSPIPLESSSLELNLKNKRLFNQHGINNILH